MIINRKIFLSLLLYSAGFFFLFVNIYGYWTNLFKDDGTNENYVASNCPKVHKTQIKTVYDCKYCKSTETKSPTPNQGTSSTLSPPEDSKSIFYLNGEPKKQVLGTYEFGTCKYEHVELVDPYTNRVRFFMGETEIIPDYISHHQKVSLTSQKYLDNFKDLIILLEFWSEFAEENKILYAISHGQVLGYCIQEINQHLFWDDDADVIVGEKDLPKLAKLYKKSPSSGHKGYKKFQYKGTTFIMEKVNAGWEYWYKIYTESITGGTEKSHLDLWGCYNKNRGGKCGKYCKGDLANYNTKVCFTGPQGGWGLTADINQFKHGDIPWIDYCGIKLRGPKREWCPSWTYITYGERWDNKCSGELKYYPECYKLTGDFCRLPRGGYKN